METRYTQASNVRTELPSVAHCVVLRLDEGEPAAPGRRRELCSFVAALDEHLLVAASFEPKGRGSLIRLEGHEGDVELMALIIEEAFPECGIARAR